MAEAKKIEMRYFSPRAGRVCVRFGSNAYIGATRTAKGYIIDTTAVVAIPKDETRRYVKEYRNLLRERIPGLGADLVEVKEEAYDAYLEARAAKRDEARDKRKAEQAKAAAAAKPEGNPAPGADDSEPSSSDE